MARRAQARRRGGVARAVLAVLVAAGGGLADATCAVGYTGTPCVMCAAGKYKNSVGTEACYTCFYGKYSWAGLSACKECIPGTFTDKDGMSECKICTAGTYQSQSAAVGCTLCQKGTYSAHNGATACTRCIPGSVSITTGEAACTLCPAGTYSTWRDEPCQGCYWGTYSNTVVAYSSCVFMGNIRGLAFRHARSASPLAEIRC
jgi:hypothetical protein